MNDRDNLIWYLKDIISNDGCKHCFQEYIKNEIGRFNKTIENDILDLMVNSEEGLKEMLIDIILQMPSWYFNNETITKMIEDKFNEDAKDINYEDLY